MTPAGSNASRLLALSLVFAGLPVAAQVPFEVLDGNDDGALTQEEFTTSVFSEWDRDQDPNQVLAPQGPPGQPPEYPRFDRDAEPPLMGQPFHAGLFEELDADGDGVIQAEEYRAYFRG